MFEQMSIAPNAYTYSILFKLCAQSSDRQTFQFGKTIWKNISIDYQKNPIVSTSFLQLLLKNEQISTCEQFFSQMEKNNITYIIMMKGSNIHLLIFNVVSSFLSGYLLHEMPQKALDLFLLVDKPDEILTTLFFNACAQLKDQKTLNLARRIYSQLPCQSNRLLQSAFNAFFQHKDICKAEILFEKVNRDTINYISLMKLYNEQHRPEKTLQLFKRMKNENIERNELIFALVINACANVRFLSLSQSIVQQIPVNFLDDHWIQTALIDMWVSSYEIYERR